MDEQGLLGELIRSGVLQEHTSGELTVDESVVDAIETIRSSPNDWDRTDSQVVERFGWETVIDSDFLSQSVALEHRLPALATDDLLKASLAFGHLRHDSPDEGTPAGFVPLPGHHLHWAVSVVERCLVYVWKRDCDPCDTMRDRFELNSDEISEGPARFSVFGPARARELSEAFDVSGAPTVLFVADGEVKSRLVGEHPYSTVEREIELLVEE